MSEAVPNPIVIPIDLVADQVLVPIDLVTDQLFIPIDVSISYDGTRIPDFTGDYVYTPTREEQIIEIADHRAVENITINPIPSNYGLITWDGSVLTVS